MFFSFKKPGNRATNVKRGIFHRIITVLLSALLIAASFLISGCASLSTDQSVKTAEKPDAEAQWGIRIVSIRLTAAGHMLDFRYKVVDPEKASTLLDRRNKSYLVHQNTGVKMTVPRTRLGPLRQTAVKPVAGKDYFILFGNMGEVVKQGDKVTVVVGVVRAENLIVE